MFVKAWKSLTRLIPLFCEASAVGGVPHLHPTVRIHVLIHTETVLCTLLQGAFGEASCHVEVMWLGGNCGGIDKRIDAVKELIP